MTQEGSPTSDLALWEQELGPIADQAAELADADPDPPSCMGRREILLAVLALLLAGPVGFLIGLCL